ncbi:hypothetical protein NE237_026653 [Protea cynaroides]|uniref:Transcription factor n=1 Tax=Protea cynaroides TaxID=273540 RepID=A0A9Q0H453_9MAGN|nr:hypothetical protein NE237_026653 [Protea cynaroides]
MNLWTADNASMMEAFLASDMGGFDWASSSSASTLNTINTANPSKTFTQTQPSMLLSQEMLQQRLQALIKASADDAVDEEVTDTEWFFLVSMTQSFVASGGLPGQVFFNSMLIWLVGRERLANSSCERVRQGLYFGDLAAAQSTTIPFDVGVILDYNTEDTKKSNASMSMALNDFYARNSFYKTRLVLHTRDSKQDVVHSAFMDDIVVLVPAVGDGEGGVTDVVED